MVLGEFEQMVLLAVLRLRDDAYGVTIRAEIAKRTGREIARGALHTTLDRLEEKGCLRSRMGDPTPQRGGRASAPGICLRSAPEQHFGFQIVPTPHAASF
jgi:hypothetical protein